MLPALVVAMPLLRVIQRRGMGRTIQFDACRFSFSPAAGVIFGAMFYYPICHAPGAATRAAAMLTTETDHVRY